MIKNISGFSTALFSTWYFIEDLGILFDCGDGVTAHLLAKARKVKYVFISHPDRDHITGLSQLLQLNARDGFPKIYYPKDSGSFPAMKDFFSKFDPHVQACEWIPMDDGQEVELKKGLVVQAFRNEHVASEEGVIKSLSYKVFSIKKKLKTEFLKLEGKEIKQLKETESEEFIFNEIRENVITFSGDTPIENDGRWDGSKILIHEATFLDKTILSSDSIKKKNQHSTLEEVIKMASESNIEQLILGHFSIRYSPEELAENLAKLKEKYQLTIPVYTVFPGEFKETILLKN